MAKQPTKKPLTKKSLSVTDLKSKMGLNVEDKGLVSGNADKPLEWIVFPSAFQKALKLPGIPMGYMSGVTGWSDTGKSTIVNVLIASCMKQGIIPIIFDTEGNFNFEHAIDCGMNATPVRMDVEVEKEYMDEESGEIMAETVEENRVVDYTGDFFLFNNNSICEFCGDMDYKAGTQKKTKRSVAVIEDVAYIINYFLDLQDEGEIDKPLCFIWDSIGSVNSYKAYDSKGGNAMWDAAALSTAFNSIVNLRIPGSKSIGRKHSNTMFVVNKIWNDSMNSMGGVPSIELKGGKSIYYSLRLLIHVGGVAKAATKKLKATYKGDEYQYGTVTKIQVKKNHLPTPYNITYTGTMCCVHNGIVAEEDLNDYKKHNIPIIMERLKNIAGGKLEGQDINVDEMSFVEEGELDN